MPPKKVLVVDDEENLRHMLSVLLKKEKYRVETAADGEEALRLATSRHFDYILCDIRMPVMDGAEFLRCARDSEVPGTIIMMSAYGTIDTAIECMRGGAYDYISKPFKKEEILLVLRKAEERERLQAENRSLREELQARNEFSGIVSSDPNMLEIFRLVRRLGEHSTTVLILGESGVGKELVARALHFQGVRRDAPFLPVNCGAIPDSLLESELFGHVKGAFTDAVSDREGLFEMANGGTVFLDEIGEMSPTLQVKLLRVLQEGEIRPVGAASSRKVDVRVVSATSRDLEREVEQGHFREDLYYRINVFSLRIPPLRERMDGVPLLAEHFLRKLGGRMGRSAARMTPDAVARLMSYRWPGNIRELENCIERSLVLNDGDLITDVPLPMAEAGGEPCIAPDDTLSLKVATERLERAMIAKVLQRTGGNRTHAARMLEVSLRGLLYKIKEYGLE